MKLTIVRFADISGTGFDWQQDPSRPVDREFWASARRLLVRDVVQPSEYIKTTGGMPFWGLREVVVGQQPMWCFWVQGRGGAFGPAGTCRFAFADAEEDPALVWRAGVVEVAGSSEESGLPNQDDGAALFQVVGAIALRAPQIAIPGGPDRAARLIGGVLGILPRQEVRERIWATCLLQPLDGVRVAAAMLPGTMATSQMSANQYIDRINQTVGPPLPQAAAMMAALQKHFVVPELADGIGLLAQHAQQGDLLIGRLDPRPTDFADLLDRIVNEGMPLDIAKLLREPKGRDLLKGNQPAIEKWVGSDPVRALELLRRFSIQPFANWIFDGLLTLQETSKDNLIGFPLAQEPAVDNDEWPARLAQLLRGQLDIHMIATLLRDLRDRGAIRNRDLIAARGLLLATGLTPVLAHDLFPLTSNVVAESLREVGGLSRETHEELRLYRESTRGDRLGLLAEAVHKAASQGWLRPVHARDAITFFAAVGVSELDATAENRQRAAGMALRLAGASLPSERHPGRWLIDFLQRSRYLDLRGDGFAPVICAGALNALREADFTRIPASEASGICQRVGAVGAWSEVLLPIRSQLQLSLQEQRQTPATRSRGRLGSWLEQFRLGRRRPAGQPGPSTSPAVRDSRSPAGAMITRHKAVRFAVILAIALFVAGALTVNFNLSKRSAYNQVASPKGRSSGPVTSSPATPDHTIPAPVGPIPMLDSPFIITGGQQETTTAVLDYLQHKKDAGLQFEVAGVRVTGNLEGGRINAYNAELLDALRKAGFEPPANQPPPSPEPQARPGTVTVAVMIRLL